MEGLWARRFKKSKIPGVTLIEPNQMTENTRDQMTLNDNLMN